MDAVNYNNLTLKSLIFTNGKSIKCCIHLKSGYMLASTDYDCDNHELMLF